MATVVEILAKLKLDSSGFGPGLAKARAEAERMNGTWKDQSGRLRDATGRFTATGDAAAAGMGKAARATEDAGKSMGFFHKTASSAMGFIAGGAALAGIAGVGMGLKAMATTAVSAASEQQQAMISFEHMLGSQEKAAAFYKDLQNLAAKTPFEMQDVVLGTKRLLGFGYQAEQSKRMLTAMGDAASGLSTGAEGIQSMTMAFGQMKAKGKVSNEEIMQLAGQGVPALQYLADTFGTTTSQMQDMLSKGLIPADKGVDAIVAGLEKGTKNAKGFGGMMAKQSETLQGVWSTFKDTVRMGLAEAILPYIPALSKLVTAATPLVGVVIKGLVGGFALLIKGGEKLFKILEPGFSKVVSMVRDFKSGWDGVNTGMGTAWEKANEIGLAVRAFVDAFINPDVTSNGLVGKFEEAAVRARAAYDFLAPKVTAFVGAIRDNVMPIVKMLAEFIITRVVPTLMRLAEPVSKFIGTVVTALIPALQEIKKQFEANIMPALLMFWGVVEKFVVPVISTLITFIGWVIMWLLKLVPVVLRIAGPIIGFLIKALGFVIGVIAVVVGAVIGVIKWFTNLGNTVNQFVAKAIVAIASFGQKMTQVKGMVMNAVAGAGTWLVNTGRAVVEGLWNGIKSLGGWLSGKVRSFIADHVPAPIRSALGVNSPSKVAEWIGEQVPMGLSQGMVMQTHTVEKAATKVGKAAVPKVTGASKVGTATSKTAAKKKATKKKASSAKKNLVTFVSDGTMASKAILEILRKSIRVRGGNVQVVLGSKP